jgi:eukaryotic-like serine/threonine-protein kinase
VHRDVKPENILLSERHALIADFGVAKAVQAAGTGQMASAGMAVGTPVYMAPEQAVADPTLDHRADLYAAAAAGDGRVAHGAAAGVGRGLGGGLDGRTDGMGMPDYRSARSSAASRSRT